MSTTTKPIQCPECKEVFDVDFDPTETDLEVKCFCGEDLPYDNDPAQPLLVVMQYEGEEEEDDSEVDEEEDDDEDEEEEEEEEE